MKFGNFEGSPAELNDICQNLGFKPDDFLNTPSRFQPKIWALILFAALFALISIVLWTVVDKTTDFYKAMIILNLIFTIILTILVHLRFDKWVITIVAFLGSLIILSVSLDYLTPKDAIEEMKDTITTKPKA